MARVFHSDQDSISAEFKETFIEFVQNNVQQIRLSHRILNIQVFGRLLVVRYSQTVLKAYRNTLELIVHPIAQFYTKSTYQVSADVKKAGFLGNSFIKSEYYSGIRLCQTKKNILNRSRINIFFYCICIQFLISYYKK